MKINYIFGIALITIASIYLYDALSTGCVSIRWMGKRCLDTGALDIYVSIGSFYFLGILISLLELFKKGMDIGDTVKIKESASQGLGLELAMKIIKDHEKVVIKDIKKGSDELVIEYHHQEYIIKKTDIES